MLKKDLYLRCLFKLNSLDRLDISHNCIYSLTYLSLEKNIKNSLKSLKHLFFKQVGQSFGDMFPNEKNKERFLEVLSGLNCWDFKKTPLESGMFIQQHGTQSTRLTIKESAELQIAQRLEGKIGIVPISEQCSFSFFDNSLVPTNKSTNFINYSSRQVLSGHDEEPKTPLKPIERAQKVKSRILSDLSKSQKKVSAHIDDHSKSTKTHKRIDSKVLLDPADEEKLSKSNMNAQNPQNPKNTIKPFFEQSENKENNPPNIISKDIVIVQPESSVKALLSKDIPRSPLQRNSSAIRNTRKEAQQTHSVTKQPTSRSAIKSERFTKEAKEINEFTFPEDKGQEEPTQ